MFKKNKNKTANISNINTRRVADKRSVFDSDFIGREGRINPKTVKEVSMAFALCSVLTIVFYLNFYHRKSAAANIERIQVADPAILEKLNFISTWQQPEKLTILPESPMLDTNKLLEYQRKHSGEVVEVAKKEEKPSQPQTSILTRIKITLRGVLWDANGNSTALIDREMLKKGDTYKGYLISEVLRQAVILEDENANRIRLNVGEDKEIIANQTIEVKK